MCLYAASNPADYWTDIYYTKCAIKMTGSDLKTLRESKRLTQVHLAEELGVTSNTVARWERDEVAIPKLVEKCIGIMVERIALRAESTRRLPSKDAHHASILSALNGHIDPALFEACATELLKRDWPTLVPVSGGSDDGFDGAIALPGSSKPWPLVCTTGKDLVGNLRRNLSQAKRKGYEPKCSIFATSRHVSGQTRRRLQSVADAEGVGLRQIYDQSWFATELYHNASWCKRLLNLSGTPAALTQVIPSPRVMLSPRMLGRDTEIVTVRDSKGDVLVSGGPGSGKSHLLGELTRSEGFFAVSDDREALANAVREMRPHIVMIDDVHVNQERLTSLCQLRLQLGESFRIVVSCWEPYTPSIRQTLGKPLSVKLQELDMETVAEIVHMIGLKSPARLVREIVSQAQGHPGLAATLADLCLRGDAHSVLSGQAIFDQLARVTGDDHTLLACFALAGDRGMPIETVADFLRRPQDNVQQKLSDLASAGVIRVSYNREFSVWPKPFRAVVLREVFFGRHSGLDWERLQALAPDQLKSVAALIRATAHGAHVPRLEERLEELNDARLWTQYAELSPTEAGRVLDAHPEHLPRIAPQLLKHIPDRALAALLDQAAGESTAGDRGLPSLEDIKSWLEASGRDPRRLLEKRQLAIRTTRKWWDRTRQTGLASVIAAWALSPEFEVIESDAKDAIVVTRGLLMSERLHSLSQGWEEILPLIRNTQDVAWKEILRLVRRWAFPEANFPMPNESLEVAKNTARRMVSDLATIAVDNPAVQHELKRLGNRLKLRLAWNTEPTFELLYPEVTASAWTATTKRHERRVRQWALAQRTREPTEFAQELVRLESLAERVGVKALGYMGVVFDEASKQSGRSEAWLGTLVELGASAERIRPFAESLMARGESVGLALMPLLSNPRYEATVIEAVLRAPNAASDLVEVAIDRIRSHLDLLAGLCRTSKISDEHARRLLQHSNREVRATTAVFCADPKKRLPITKGEDWLAAFLETASGVELSTVGEYHLKAVLKSNRELATSWLAAFAGHEDRIERQIGEIALAVCAELSVSERKSLLAAVSNNLAYSEIVKILVGRDLDLYNPLLEREDVPRHHLIPLQPRQSAWGGTAAPGADWPAKVELVLARGYSEDEVLDATLPSHWRWSGSEVGVWDSWRRAFEQFVERPESAVARVAKRGLEKMRRRVESASERERVEAVRGLHWLAEDDG